jgi:putative transposase
MAFAIRKQIGLSSVHYLGRRIYFVTICCEGRRAFFNRPNRCNIAVESLKRIADSMHFLIHAYCVMPDHSHILAEGRASDANLVKFMAKWKQSTGYLLREESLTRLRQRRFYDHVLSKATYSESVAWYIWMNPVRKGMIARPEQYPFSGSFTVDWPSVPAPDATWRPPWKSQERAR